MGVFLVNRQVTCNGEGNFGDTRYQKSWRCRPLVDLQIICLPIFVVDCRFLLDLESSALGQTRYVGCFSKYLVLGHPTATADLWGTFRSEGVISSNLANLDMGVSEGLSSELGHPTAPARLVPPPTSMLGSPSPTTYTGDFATLYCLFISLFSFSLGQVMQTNELFQLQPLPNPQFQSLAII